MTSLSVRFGGAELEFHAVSSGDGTVLAVKHGVLGTGGLLDGDTILARLVEYSIRRALGNLLCTTLLAVEFESLRAPRINGRIASVILKVGSFRARWRLTNAGFAVEHKVSTVRFCGGDALAIFEDISWLTMLFNNASAFSVLPKEFLRALGLCRGLTASVHKYLSERTAWNSVYTISIV
jgi:hypothetical protein